VKFKAKMRLLTMSRTDKEKRLDELNRKLTKAPPQQILQNDVEERDWLRRKLGYK
jgi:hypothetical protein